MRNLIKVSIFALSVIGAYTLFAVYFVPPSPSAGTPENSELRSTGAMTREGLVKLGEEVFNGKGSCTLCHNALMRAPLLDGMNDVALLRMKDSRYKGKAMDMEGYLRESMEEPSAYVVKGYGTTGSNDTVSPMPDVRRPPLSLTETEIRAVIAYLQDRAGVDVTVAN